MDKFVPKWSKEIERFLPIKPQFMLSGNVYDVYPIRVNSNIMTLKINDYLKHILKMQGYDMVTAYEPLYGFSLLEGDNDLFKKITGESIISDSKDQATGKPMGITLRKAAQVIEEAVNNSIAYSAMIINFSSRLADIAQNDINEFYYKMFRLSQNASPRLVKKGSEEKKEYPKYNIIIWIADKENDIPAWYTLDNPKLKILPVPKPDYDIRKVIIEALSKNIMGFNELEESKRRENLNIFVDQTNKLYSAEIVSIVSMARREGLDFNDIGEAIKRYKLGIVENPWSKIDKEKIMKAEEHIGKRVKGQKRAIVKSCDIIKRSIYNLSGVQYSKYSQRPKGVLFFAGSTGVGKTELAKSITELIFGSENSCIRFDMSEFSKEHSDQRLIGAPPGYVGYDVGGELTNAIKQNPFSVILFDEIEKASPKILDIFLQILDDGRLTSGRGETVYFSECIIIFTSNLGMFEIRPEGEKVQKVKPEMSYEEIEKSMKESIESFFKFKIGRPEILNRIGENIIVFDFIRESVAREIFEKMYKSITDKLKDTYDITLTIEDAAKEKLEKMCSTDLNMGGRGIGNKLEEYFINPLSRALFSISSAPAGENPSNYFIKAINEEDGIWKIDLMSLS